MERKGFSLSKISIPVVVVLLFSFRAYTAMGVNFFIPVYNAHERLFYICASMFLFLYLLMVGRRVYLDDITMWCALLIGIILVWNNYDLKNGEYHKLFSCITVMLFFLLFRVNTGKNWKYIFTGISIVTSLFYTFFTIASFLSPTLYRTLAKTLNKFAVYDLMEFYEAGYMAGITAHYTTNGIYLMSGVVPLGLMLFCTRGKLYGKAKMCVGLAFILNVLALLLSGKRSHVIFTMIALVVVIYLFNSDRPKGRLVKLLVCIGLALALIVILSNFIPEVLNVINRFLETQEDTGSIMNGREDLQVDIYSAIAENPLFGKGWAWYPWNNSYAKGTCCHNVYLQLFGELGVFGAIPFMLFFVRMLYRGVRLLIYARVGRVDLSLDEQIMLGVAIGFQIYFLLYCTTGNPLYDFNCYFPYYVWCAIQESFYMRFTS